MVQFAMKELEKWKSKKRRKPLIILPNTPPNEVVPRIRMLWNSIPAQLTRENKKFICGTAGVDFVIDNGSGVIPVEVKAEQNLQAKSLKVYREKFQPRLSIRTSMADYKKDDWLLHMQPSYNAALKRQVTFLP